MSAVTLTRGRAAGMSLVEILVAMVILTLGATSLIALFASASSTHKRAVDRTHAALVAEELFSEVQARYFLNSNLHDMLADLRNDLPERINGYYWEVTLYQPGGGQQTGGSRLTREDTPGPWSEDELIVHVAIKWSRAAQSREETYTAILLPRPLAIKK